MKPSIFILMTVILLFSCETKRSQGEDHIKSVFIQNVERILKSEVPKLQQEFNVPAVGIGLIENGKIKFVEVYGQHQIGKTAPKNTIFNVASITKALTAVVTMKLASNGDWNLDEPLSNYWIDSDIRDNPLHKKITTRNALSHTIGFKNWRRMNESGKLEFDFEPGEKFQYSGEGFEYLRQALEHKFDKDLGILADSLVFYPIGMKDATLEWIPEDDTIRFAKWHDSNGKVHNVSDYSTPEASAADDLLTTVEDLVKFGIAVMDTTFLDKKWYNQMITPQVEIHSNAKQALGWTIINNLPDNHYALNHDGGDIGVATTLILLPKTQSGILVFTNGDNGRILCNAIVKKTILFGNEIIQKLYWGGEIPEIIQLETKTIEKYSGIYLTNQGTTMQFVARDNALKIKGEGIPEVEIYPKSESEFFPADFEVFFQFEETTDDTKFKLLNQGKVVLEGKKTTTHNNVYKQ